MTVMAQDALTAALKAIADGNGLTRIDIGYAPYRHEGRTAHALIWFDAPEGVIGYASEFAHDADSAIDAALATKARKLSDARIAEAA